MPEEPEDDKVPYPCPRCGEAHLDNLDYGMTIIVCHSCGCTYEPQTDGSVVVLFEPDEKRGEG